ncbi:hypothetical protein [Algibacter aquimarinus]|uniref:CPBP family intramembrane metalloprotease n=1 Tax=Algibacter aquimarinus TaxID=1136748 RepID=A0ABP9HRN8_9FLAO
MIDFIKKYEVWIFLILAPISNTIFVYLRILELIPGRVYMYGRFLILLFLLIVIVKITKGNVGLKNIFKPMKKWHIPFKWYFFALIFAPSVACLTLFLKANYLGDFSIFKMNVSLINNFDFMFNIILWAFVGEVVWVSYAVRELSKVMNILFASQIVGLTWGFWWAPIVWLNFGVIPDLPLWPMIINMMGAAGMCAYIYVQTKSGICVWLLQCMLNTSIVLFQVAPTTGGILTYKVFSILYFTVMLVFMYSLNRRKKIKTININ